MEIVVTKYSEKSYKLTGKDGTTKYKEKLKEMGVRFNRFLKIDTKGNPSDEREPGWIVGLKTWEKVKPWLKSIESDELKVIWPK